MLSACLNSPLNSPPHVFDARLFTVVLFSCSLHLTLAQFMNEILDSVEEKVKEGENWVEPEDLADNFAKAKEQQDLMKVRRDVVLTLVRPCLYDSGIPGCLGYPRHVSSRVYMISVHRDVPGDRGMSRVTAGCPG